MPVKGEPGPPKKKSSAIDTFCQVFLPALGMFVLGVGIVCWMNCPDLHVNRYSGGSVDNSAATSIRANHLRTSYMNNVQRDSNQVSQANLEILKYTNLL
jgi:hypothetical protein